MKKCRICKTMFTPSRTTQTVCGHECAFEWVKQNKAKQARKELKEAKERIKSRADWTKEAQQAFNKFIRLRDGSEPCISCQRHHTGQYHAGHYLTTGARPELRFEPLNCHKQCSACNNHLSGNVILYRKSLIEKIGQEKVDWLEGPHEAKHYSIEELKLIKRKYQQLAKEFICVD